ncbi:hypothetical protein ABFX02_08G049100 [Erythranthe guttata]
MRRNSGSSFRNSGAYTSPGTPEYGDISTGEIPKTWSSERVPLPSNSSSRRHVSAAALMPFNSGRALPSKWDDAERWITSPISGYGAFKNSIVQPQRRPKSKSGPLGPAGLGYLPNYSPNVIGHEGGNVRNFMANSPLTTGVFVPDGLLSVHYEAAKLSDSSYVENNITRSTSVPGLSDLLSETSALSSRDEKRDAEKEEEEEAHVSRRDMATQMSPEEGSTNSSTRARLSFSVIPSSSSARLSRNHVTRDDVRDVQVDKGTTTTTTTSSKKNGPKKMDVKDSSSSWNVSEASKNIAKLQREEAKITAWENLQKAKAEAAIRKLEMKLEKKRSSSMDKITNKLRAAEMKAQAMRNSVSENRAPRSSRRRISISCCIYFKIPSVCSCFVCKKK